MVRASTGRVRYGTTNDPAPEGFPGVHKISLGGIISRDSACLSRLFTDNDRSGGQERMSSTPGVEGEWLPGLSAQISDWQDVQLASHAVTSCSKETT